MRTPGQNPTSSPIRQRPVRALARGGGFTLVELLVTMSIVTLLIGLGVAALRGLNSGTNRRSAVGTLMGVLDQARGVAISDGRCTYVVFVSAPRSSTQNTSTVAPQMWGQAYALFEDPVLQDSSTASSFQPQQRSTWLYLPTGVAFKSDSGSDNTPASLTAVAPNADDPTKFNVPGTNGKPTSVALPYVKFDATGQIISYKNQVLDPGSPLSRILLFQGVASSTGVETLTHRNTEITGTKVKFALDEIMLKPITGRARYTQDPVYNLSAAN